MTPCKPYEEVINFIAAGRSVSAIIAFRPSEEARARVYDLVAWEKEGGFRGKEKSKLDHYLEREHLMHLAKARARQFLAGK